ncbi:PspA-associated protein PspAB [Embleya sp. NPDC055664]|uniref:PspA-associated protein PspAB n=1 Tax=Embleya sp. NPDC059237 TaxID=3346784 RepID=UPI0036C4ED2C
MGLFDSLFGRSRAVKPDLDQLFGLPSAAITLEAAVGFRPTGAGSVCFATVEGGTFDRVLRDLDELLDGVRSSRDDYGYTWLLAERPPEDTGSLVTDLHAINSALEDGGFGPQLLCSLAAFGHPDGRRLALVYLYKRGTFYPFAPVPGGHEKRDSALELQVGAAVTDDLRLESDLSRWFPVWGAPGL